jgi:hypothetical protein
VLAPAQSFVLSVVDVALGIDIHVIDVQVVLEDLI